MRRHKIPTIQLLALCFAMFISVTSLYAIETGHVQVQTDPGVRIFLDGVEKGRASEDLGVLVLTDIPVGEHEIMLLKPDEAPQIGKIRVSQGEVLLYKSEAWNSKVLVSQDGDQDSSKLVVGSVIIQSLPINCTIRIEGLDIELQKNKDKVSLSEVPIGEYKAEFESSGKKLTYSLRIMGGFEEKLMVNFIESKVVSRLEGVMNERVTAKNTISGSITTDWPNTHPNPIPSSSPDGRRVGQNAVYEYRRIKGEYESRREFHQKGEFISETKEYTVIDRNGRSYKLKIEGSASGHLRSTLYGKRVWDFNVNSQYNIYIDDVLKDSYTRQAVSSSDGINGGNYQQTYESSCYPVVISFAAVQSPRSTERIHFSIIPHPDALFP